MITQEHLKELLHYDIETGIFTWKQRISIRIMIGWVAGTNSENKSINIIIYKKRYKAHRLAWLYVYGKWPENKIDHIDGNPLNNRIDNLRDVTQSVNMQNLKMATKKSTTGLLGVYYHHKRKKFWCEIHTNKKSKFLGYFDTAEEASKKYLETKRKIHPGCTI